MTDSYKFVNSLNMAKGNYDRTGDLNRYIGDCLKVSLQLLADENGHSKVSSVLSVTSPIFSAIVDYGETAFICPVDARHSVSDFLSGLNDHIKDRLRRDYYEPAEKYLPQKASEALNRLIALA